MPKGDLRRAWMGSALLVLLLNLPSCKEVLEDKVLHRSNCLVCHRPLDSKGQPDGIEEAHAGVGLSCTDCHGGQAYICDGGEITYPEGADDPECSGEWVYDLERAHVDPGDSPKFIKNLSGDVLDQVDPEYLRFINPGDFRVLDKTCAPCHPSQTAAVLNSTMSHTSGEITVARYRSGAQPTPRGLYGAVDLVDETFPEAEGECAVPELERFDPPKLAVDAADPTTWPSVAELQDQYMVKSCFRCHLNDFGENRFQGDFRSSGCTACHMPYSDEGLYEGNDPMINKEVVPHPRRHELTKSPDIETCTHCHYRGGRLGISYQGYRESAGSGYNPDRPSVLGLPLHGHDANYYLTDENSDNDWDETPPDLHFEAGMVCVDCHTTTDVHGDGHLYADTQCAVTTECEDCHGSVREYASQVQVDARDNLTLRDGKYFLTLKATGAELEVPQTKDSVTEGHPNYNARADQAMGVNADGVSHTDKVECYTCHAAWIPTCYGCHVQMDMSQDKAYHTTGEMAPGRPTGRRKWLVLNDLVLMTNVDGKYAPSMPAERFFMTLVAKLDGETDTTVLYADKPRSFTVPDGRTIAAFGQRAFNPHTTRRKSQFQACDRCHTVGDPADPDNRALLDLTYGFGTERFLEQACDVSNADDSCDPATDYTTYPLDAIQTVTGDPLVVVGHPDPTESRPLRLDEIEAMQSVIVPTDPPVSTVIPEDALTNPWWPAAVRFDDQVYPPEDPETPPTSP